MRAETATEEEEDGEARREASEARTTVTRMAAAVADTDLVAAEAAVAEEEVEAMAVAAAEVALDTEAAVVVAGAGVGRPVPEAAELGATTGAPPGDQTTGGEKRSVGSVCVDYFASISLLPTPARLTGSLGVKLL